MAEKIYVSSFKGGVGVTTFCVGLALSLAANGAKTLIVDGDHKCGCALTISGCANLQVFTLTDYAQGSCRAKQILVSHPTKSNIFILPTLGCNDADATFRAVTETEGLFDFILLDSCAKNLSDKAIVITEPYLASIKSADACVAWLCDSGIKDVSVVVNKVNGGFIFDGEIMPPEEIAYLLHAPLKAVIPEDLCLPLGKWKTSTLKAFNIAALNISGKKDKIYSVIRGYYGVKGAIKRKLRNSL